MNFNRDSIYGSGFGYPFTFDDATGGAGVASGKESVVASLIRLFDTAPGEEFMLPEYGCALKNLVFEQDTDVLRALALTVIQEAVARWEPRVERVLDIQIEEDESRPNALGIRVFFRLIKDQTQFNFVYPFAVPS